MISEGKLYVLGEDNDLIIYDMVEKTRSIHQFNQMNEILYIYVDAEGSFIAEGSTDAGFCRAVLSSDGNYTISDADLELDVVKKVKTKNN